MRKNARNRTLKLHNFLVKAKIWGVELAITVVFFWWLYHAVVHEIGVLR